ncbi:MAG: primosomal protein N' [Tissierellia bacterium]|nr:primosomal protein N' [Tissierellia bacterium]
MSKYVNVLIKRNVLNLDRLFTYRVPDEYEEIIEPGMRVIVNFSNSLEVSLVMSCSDDSSIEDEVKIKDIIEVIDSKPIVNKDLINLGLWMRNYYILTYAKAFEPILGNWNISDIKFEYKIIDNIDDTNLTEIEKTLISKISSINLDAKNLSKDEKIVIRELEEKGFIQSKISYKRNIKYKTVVKRLEKSYEEATSELRANAKAQKEAVDFIYSSLDVDEYDYEYLRDTQKISLNTLKSLEEKRIIDLFKVEERRHFIDKAHEEYIKRDLNDDQLDVIHGIINSSKNKFLLHGITGSGKTEVYLRLTEENLNNDKDTIILVPEIGLTPQMIERFDGRFGDTVAIIHSGLSVGERQDELNRIRNGEAKIVVGARSAIFAPFSNIGLIIIDEEHENTYRSNEHNKYDVRDIGNYLSENINDCKLVMGSATPSIETYYNAIHGKYELYELNDRATKSILPEVHLVDMREELNNGNMSIFSYDLLSHMKTALIRHEQIILFLNRRGFSSFVSCRNCGYVVKCDDCDVSMVYHKEDNKMQCHYCGKSVGAYRTCPNCGSRYIKHFGVGTQQVEEMTRNQFVDFKVGRMDSDTTTRKGSHEAILDSVKKGDIDILIGTQMIAKGLDFSNITVVGVIAADLSLNLPTLYASEETFQLVTQVAGRAGRGDKPGNVIVQTYNPDHYSLQFAKNHDYKGFFEEEIKIRRMFNYPPFTRMFSILISHPDEKKVEQISNRVFTEIKSEINRLNIGDYIKFNGVPHPDSRAKLKNSYRYNISIISVIKYDTMLKDVLYRVCMDNERNIDLANAYIDISFR